LDVLFLNAPNYGYNIEYIVQNGVDSMSITKFQTELYCINCKEDTVHEITYVGENIEKIACKKCESELHINEELILSAYAGDVFQRIRTKPDRISEEIKQDLGKFLCSIPIRLITKPYRMVKEYNDTKKDIQK